MKDVQELARQGKLNEADDLAIQYQLAYPDNPEVPFARAVLHRAAKAWPTAIELAETTVRMRPDEPRYQAMLGTLLLEAARFADAEAAMRSALSRLPDAVDLSVNLGAALMLQHKNEEAAAVYQQLLERVPDPAIGNNYARCLERLRRFDEAEEEFRQLIAAVPSEPTFRIGLMRVLRSAERYSEALSVLNHWSVESPLDPQPLTEIGRLYHHLNVLPEAESAFERALYIDPEYPDAQIGRAAVMGVMGKTEEGMKILQGVLARFPKNADAHSAMGVLCTFRRQFDNALEHLTRATELAPHEMHHFYRLGQLLRNMGERSRPMIAQARDALRKAVALDPGNEITNALLFSIAQTLCDWDTAEELEPRLIEYNREFCTWPFELLAMQSATRQDILLGGRHYAAGIVRERDFRGLKPYEHASRRGRGRPARLKVGYLSADLRAHATSLLAAQMFESHSRERFEWFAYSVGPDDGSALRERVRRAFDHFAQIPAEMSDADLATRIVEDGIDILVDMNAYTAASRFAAMVLRPAPVQVEYLGYPGTTGADFVDYVVTDRVVSPPEEQVDYTERLAFMPGSYQCNDSGRSLPPVPTRAACGLPEQGFVFCCFNQQYKITRRMFETWIEILQAVPGSVLWLLEGSVEAEQNLRRHFSESGLAAERLIIAPRAGFDDHMARLQVANLALDTLPYNMHTTASDALWAGVPYVTCPGETFASRVGASLLQAVGMPELIVPDLAAYRDLAVALATDRERYDAVRERLLAQRAQSSLFDGRRFAADLEDLYEQMWARFDAGLEPEQLSVRG